MYGVQYAEQNDWVAADPTVLRYAYPDTAKPMKNATQLKLLVAFQMIRTVPVMEIEPSFYFRGWYLDRK